MILFAKFKQIVYFPTKQDIWLDFAQLGFVVFKEVKVMDLQPVVSAGGVTWEEDIYCIYSL